MVRMEQAHLNLSLEYLCRLEGGRHFRAEASQIYELSASLTRLKTDFELVFDPTLSDQFALKECVICMELFESY